MKVTLTPYTLTEALFDRPQPLLKLCIYTSRASTSPHLKFAKRRRCLLIWASPVHRSCSWYQLIWNLRTHTYTPVQRPSFQVSLFPLTFSLSVRKKSGEKVHSMRGNWCRDFVAGSPSCRQPMLTTSTGTHPFFNHKLRPCWSLLRLLSDVSTQ